MSHIQIKINIPTPLRVYTQHQKSVTVNSHTVSNALGDLVEKFPKLQAHLFDQDKLRNFVNVYLNDEDIRYLPNLNLTEGDTITIIPSIAGGI